MILNFLGTCAGTEPIPDRNHQSLAVEINHTLYWFDAGACCSRTAHLMGLDLLTVKKIVISHTHMDHVGGLGNLLWDIRKIKWLRSDETKHNVIDLYIPSLETWDGFSKVLRNTEGSFSGMKVNVTRVEAGLLFSDENMTVTAFHNQHLGIPADGIWRSFTYIIEAEGKKLIYSGDIDKLSELTEIIGTGCDVMLIETGHHHYLDVCNYMNGKGVKKLCFTHNGRSILEDPAKAAADVSSSFGDALICSDGTSLIVD